MGMPKYHAHFNSGLMFIRRLEGIDYEGMKKMLYELAPDRDQGIVSLFVQREYQNWDVLSWKWHCRFLGKLKQDVPPEHCYTIHDRSEVLGLLKQLNRTRLTVP